MSVMHDSGERQQFAGGAQRDTAEGKPQWSLLGPHAIAQLLRGWGGDHIMEFLLTRDVGPLYQMLEDMEQHDTPGAVDRLCEWLRIGAEKYCRFNWAKGMPVSRCVDSLCRHLYKCKNPVDGDPEDHMAAAMCNVMFLIHFMECTKNGYLDPKWNDLFNFNIIDSTNNE